MKLLVYLLALTGWLSVDAAQTEFQPTDWPMWRGLHGDGHAKAIKGLSVKWNDSKNVVWKIKLPGRGHSTPTIVGERIYLATAATELQVQSVLCFDKGTGKLIWKTTVHKGKFVKGGNKHKSDASSSVVCDGSQLYVSFPNDKKIHTTALSMKGKVVWQRPLQIMSSIRVLALRRPSTAMWSCPRPTARRSVGRWWG